MNVGELREALADYDDEAEVTLGFQQNYPLQYTAFKWLTEDDEGNVVILEGRQMGYGSKDWW